MERLRGILGPEYDLSEAELETLRREMHELAEIIVEAASVRLVRPAPATCLFFRDLERPEIELEKVVARTGFEPVLPA